MIRTRIGALENKIQLPSEPDDKELTLAFKRGETGAYQAIHDRYSLRVHNVCRRMLVNPDDAQEASQEAFLRVYQALGRFNGRYQLGPWITRIATNVCLDHLRARSRKPSDATPMEVFELEPDDRVHADPEVVSIRNAESRRVRKVLDGLPPMHRAAIVLRDFEGLSYEEVAIALGVTDVQVKALIHRARQNFKRSWTSALMPVFLPVRQFAARVRDYIIPASEQAVHAAGSNLCLVTAGAERVCALAAVVVVGASTLGWLPGQTRELTPAPPRSHEGTRDVATGSDSGGAVVLPVQLAVSKKKEKLVRQRDAAPQTQETAPPATEVEEPVATPEPSAAPTASPVPSDGGGATPTKAPSPTPAPSPAEPAGFAMAFSTSLSTTATCSCSWATSVASEWVDIGADGGGTFGQTLTGMAEAAGTPSYGLQLDFSTNAFRNQDIAFSLTTSEGTYRYSGTGIVDSVSRTSWGGWRYTVSGSYSLSSRPTKSEDVPEQGSYKAEILVSSANHRVVSTAFSLT